MNLPRRDPPLLTQAERIGSHRRAMLDAIARTAGPILELGCGDQSTPMLHDIAVTHQRKLVTIDNDPQWIARYRHLQDFYHSIVLVESWDEAPLEELVWGCALVDHSPPQRRAVDIRRLVGRCHLIVAHDADMPEIYGYDKLKDLTVDKLWTLVSPHTIVYIT